MSAVDNEVPDLLQRFVPTPYNALIKLFDTAISFQCNDKELIASLEQAGAKNRGTPSLAARLVRDYAAPSGGLDITVISTSPVATIMVGAGTVLAVDLEHREIFGFIAASVSAEDFINTVLPVALETASRLTTDKSDVHKL
jgi:hypothetical protein